MYLFIGDIQTAIDIMGERGWVDQLIDLGRRLDKNDKQHLMSIADHLKRLKQSGPATELYKRLGDSAAVLTLHVESKEWIKAFNLIQTLPQYAALVYTPYAHWLAENDKFVQAQKAFHQAGNLEEAFKVLQQLTENAVVEHRFHDAGYYYWVLSQQCIEVVEGHHEKSDHMLAQFHKNRHLADVYYAYHVVHKYLEEPFTSYLPEALFNIARFLMVETSNDCPRGVSMFSILYCLAKQAKKLACNKLAKQLFDRIQTLKVPVKFQEQVEIGTVALKARSYSDPEDLLPMCYRCSTYNPLCTNTNCCIHCGQTFVHSFVSFGKDNF